jgi:hypothetical protein
MKTEILEKNISTLGETTEFYEELNRRIKRLEERGRSIIDIKFCVMINDFLKCKVYTVMILYK